MEDLFFNVSKVLRPFLQVEAWIALGIAIGLLFRRRAFGTFASAMALALLLVVGFVPIGKFLAVGLERMYPERPDLGEIDGIVVLSGGRVTAYPVSKNSTHTRYEARRNIAAALLANDYPEARVVYTGYPYEVREFFHNYGVREPRLILETEARNTSENARNSFRAAQPKPGERWVLVTSALHMPRAMATFRKAGWENLIAWPVDYHTRQPQYRIAWKFTDNVGLLNKIIAEYAGFAVYRLAGFVE